MMNLKHKKRQHRPKLERRNAAKNIDYDAGDSGATSPSSCSFSSDDRSVYKTRSLDLAPLSDRTTSFRIEGIEGEVDEIFRYLGLGPEDLSIPVAVWEARKSSSPSSKFRTEESGDWSDLCEAGVRVGVSDANLGELSENDVESELMSKPELGARPVVAASLVGNSGETGGNGVRVKVFDGEMKDMSELNCDTGEVSGVEVMVSGGGWGIRGSRLPKLAPPPVMVRSIVDKTGSTWDILKAFGPEDDKVLGSPQNFLNDCIDEVEGNEEVVRRDDDVREEESEVSVERGRRADLESCSDSSNDENDGHDSVSPIKENDYSVSPNGSFRCTIMSWQKGDFLGSGSFGTVYEGFTDDGFFFAVKEVSLLDQGSQGQQSIYQLEQEISLLSQFQHENIVRYLGTDKGDNKLYIFLELVTKGSLAKLYQKYELRDTQVSAYTRQILNGLNYLHCRGVVHRDIKCANILVDVSGSVKLADFGLAKATKLNDIKSCKGTPFWMAPEVVNQRNDGYGRAADIWSLGCTVLEMLTRQIPYSQLEGMQALFRIGRGVLPPIPNTLSTDAKDFILNCLRVNPDDRPTAAELLEHPFVKRPPLTFHSPASPHHARRL